MFHKSVAPVTAVDFSSSYIPICVHSLEEYILSAYLDPFFMVDPSPNLQHSSSRETHMSVYASNSRTSLFPRLTHVSSTGHNNYRALYYFQYFDFASDMQLWNARASPRHEFTRGRHNFCPKKYRLDVFHTSLRVLVPSVLLGSSVWRKRKPTQKEHELSAWCI